jgi:hypothetical protein
MWVIARMYHLTDEPGDGMGRSVETLHFLLYSLSRRNRRAQIGRVAWERERLWWKPKLLGAWRVYHELSRRKKSVRIRRIQRDTFIDHQTGLLPLRTLPAATKTILNSFFGLA